tara:strand:- start:1568 stop:2410 length:843 start_codon:yes stop_codon:yes gene_type:complete
MINYPDINPVAFSIGSIQIRWYGISYIIAFVFTLLLGAYKIRKARKNNWPAIFKDYEEYSDLVFYGALGVIIGGRLGNFLFYDFKVLFTDPLQVFKVWQGGMAFHGGLLGVAVAGLIFAKRKGKNFFDLGDFIAPIVPIGLGLVRLANFINGELWGKVTNVSWGMIFPYAGVLPRHPSQLYEFFLEGVVLFIILWTYSLKRRPRMAISGMFVLFYGIFRFIIEFFREPDANLGYLAFGWVTMGQVLSLPMILIGGFMIYYAYKYNKVILKTNSELEKTSS